MKIHWTTYAFLAVWLGCVTAGWGQESVHVKTIAVRPVQQVQRLPGSGLIVPANISTFAKPQPPEWQGPRRPEPPLVVKIAFGPGGMIGEHRKLYSDYQNRGVMVELRGPCYSACTLLLAHVDADRICIAAGAFLGFHAAQSDTGPNPERRQHATNLMYATYPEPIRAWIDRQGGPEKLPGPRQGYWTMYDRDLWEMGYARCL